MASHTLKKRGRPRMATSQLKRPRAGTSGRSRGRPRMATSQLRHPRPGTCRAGYKKRRVCMRRCVPVRTSARISE